MVSMPPTNKTGTPTGDGALDWRREASMADEGGWSAALMETEETVQPAAEAPVSDEPAPEGYEPPKPGPRRLWSSLALGAAEAIARFTARARRYAARRAHARTHGH